MGDIQEKAYKKVIHYIKSEIMGGNLTLGQKLPPERELSENLQVSRNSVREAIRMMDNLGIISSQQGAGNYVSCNFEKNFSESLSMMFLLNQIEYSKLSHLRRALEREAGILAVKTITDAQLMQLRECLGQLDDELDEKRKIVIDKKFHYLLAQASGNDLIIVILQALSDIMDFFISDMRREILSRKESSKQLSEAHKLMLKGLELRNEKMLVEGIEQHFKIIEEHLPE